MQNIYTINNTLWDWNGSLVLIEFLSRWKIRYRLHNRDRSKNKFRDCKQSVNMLKYTKPISHISRASLQFHILLLRLSLSIAKEFDNIDNNNNDMQEGQDKNKYIS